MYEDQKSSSGSGASTKGDEAEIVSRFLAPLCARDENARNIALAAARTIVEGWLGSMSGPNQWRAVGDAENTREQQTGKFRSQNGRYDMNIDRSSTKATSKHRSTYQSHLRDNFRTEGFFPQSVTDYSSLLGDRRLDSIERCSVDNEASNYSSPKNIWNHNDVDAVVDNLSNAASLDEGTGLFIANHNDKCNIERDSRFGSSSESEHRLFDLSSSEKSNKSYQDELKHRLGRIKGGRHKHEDDDPDPDDRIYGKSPKFDDNMGNFGHLETSYSSHFLGREKVGFFGSGANAPVETTISRQSCNQDGVVFNTLEGFESECMIPGQEDEILETMNLEKVDQSPWDPPFSLHLPPRAIDDQKFGVGKVKNSSFRNGHGGSINDRALDGPDVTPGEVGRMLNLGDALDGPRSQIRSNKYLSLVMLHLPVILRLSVNCPFQNVRVKCAEILHMVKDRGLPVPEPAFSGPSAFIPTAELPDPNNIDERTHMLLMDAFLQNNRLDHVSQVMSSHGSYLEHFLRTQNFVLRGDGPLPYDYRHLIAIMAAGRHQCSYLINLQKGEFLLQGGDRTWLQGLRSLPAKLQNLYEINKILAHRPWLLNKTHIEKLTKGADSWSLAEVVHAIVLLAHFHSLSSFVFSCGINEELDNITGHHYKENVQDNSNNLQPAKDKLMSSPKKIPTGGGKTDNIPSPPSSPSIVGEQEVGVETLMERMKRLSEKSESYQITQEELSKRFETVETQSAELAAAPQRNSTIIDSDIGLFIDDPTFIYQDFAKRGQLNDIPTFRVQDYSWDDHGYSLVNRLYNDVGNLLDDKFKTAYNLTYYTMGTHSKVDTSRFRRAIWNYIQCMFGIRHDDYDYNEVNQLLERSLKTFIKSAVCYPERVTKRDYDRVMREFKHSEKIHVNLMILEARMQAELLYALRAVMRYMT
ncbi:sestrin-3 isoform X1 [Diachasmimorpha longicaudata]|uniref:sestrin-3 isoform X1 n=1 Tax=Diachasmimorpha longicaudata TaxID=58733 RepID=UPI0030B8EC91